MNDGETKKYIFNRLRETPKLAENYTLMNNKPLPVRNAYLLFKKFVDDFIETEGVNRLIIIPGLRGVGKTTC